MHTVNSRSITVISLSRSIAAGSLHLTLLVSCSRVAPISALDRLKPCTPAQGPTDAYCGTYQVWENRETKAGRRIPLKIVVLPALRPKHPSDPLFILAGGPGEGAAESAGDAKEMFRPVQISRDIVLVDQRGTGKSNPLQCPEPEDAPSGDDPAALANRLRACLASYASDVDLTQYTTEIAADDLDEVRQFLGYSRINLYGVSYGSRAAMVYARQHADQTRAVVLDSVAPTNFRVPLYVARDSQRALDLLFADCEKDTACRERFPNLRQRLEALLAKLTAHPLRTHYRDPHTGLEKEVNVSRLTITSTLVGSLESSTTAVILPLLIEQAEGGDFSGFLALSDALRAGSPNVALGLYYSVVCSEDAPQIEPGALEREAANTLIGAELAEARLRPCQFWPHAKIDPAYYRNFASDVPALILSGELDPLTPPPWGRQVASVWKNARHVIVPGAAHGVILSGGVMKLIGQFLDKGNASDLDTSFVQQLKRPPFFLSPSGPNNGNQAGR